MGDLGKDLGKLIVAKGFKKLPKVQKIAKSCHTGQLRQLVPQFRLFLKPRIKVILRAHSRASEQLILVLGKNYNRRGLEEMDFPRFAFCRPK